jgi:hypothetical protein
MRNMSQYHRSSSQSCNSYKPTIAFCRGLWNSLRICFFQKQIYSASNIHMSNHIYIHIFCRKKYAAIGYDVFTVLIMKAIIFWDVKPCKWAEFHRRFGKKLTASIFMAEEYANRQPPRSKQSDGCTGWMVTTLTTGTSVFTTPTYVCDLFKPHYGHSFDSASTRNEYHESSWG